jgi:hypothetical protein
MAGGILGETSGEARVGRPQRDGSLEGGLRGGPIALLGVKAADMRVSERIVRCDSNGALGMGESGVQLAAPYSPVSSDSLAGVT